MANRHWPLRSTKDQWNRPYLHYTNEGVTIRPQTPATAADALEITLSQGTASLSAMTQLAIRYFGDPILRTTCEPVADAKISDPALTTLIEDMLDTMDAAGGVGLAANQIGASIRVFVYDCEGQRGHIINPAWVAIGEETDTAQEGCLSIPGIRGDVTRASRIHLTGTTVKGDSVDMQVEGLLARCAQHETDHLNGTLFLQHLAPEQRKAAMAAIRQAEWFQQ